MVGIDIIGTSGLAIAIGPEIRDGTKNMGRPPKVSIFPIKAKVKIRGRPQMIDHGGKVYKDSECCLKTNERSLASNMPFLSEFTCYGEWKAAEKRWAIMLYNRPISSGVDYFINILTEGESSVMAKNSGVS